MWQQDEVFPQRGQTLLSAARALPPRCWAAQLSPGLRRDAGGRGVSPGSSGEERPVTGSCDGAELVERQAASAGLGPRAQATELLVEEEDTSHRMCTDGVLQ